MNYIEAKEYREKIELVVETLSDCLRKFERNDIGLIPDEIKKTKEYKETKSNFDKAFKELQTFNTYFLKQFKKEYLEERRERRIRRV